MRTSVCVGVVLGAAMVSGSARADGTPFGGAGQLAITDDQPFGAVVASSNITPMPPSALSTASFEFASVSDNGGTGTSFVLSPALDYFVIDNLSLGLNSVVGFLNPAHGTSSSGFSETILGIEPRIGYHLGITSFVSFWPKAYFGYVTASASPSGGGTSAGQNAAAIGIFAPIVFEPARHFILGVGPNLSTQVANNTSSAGNSNAQPKVTLVGVQFTIGGWCLGD